MLKTIPWVDYFMGVAKLASLRSKDPHTQVGACIVNSENKIVSVGYNGLPTGLKEENYPWQEINGQLHETKYAYVVHAELNAILNTNRNSSLKGTTIYTTLFPCNECVKAIIQAGIKKIVYLEDKYQSSPPIIAARKMLDDAGIIYVQVAFENIEIKWKSLS
ncbi:MAG: dCMP deaminase family protein [Bacillales bacterium]|jgi:dCMP deaminase|nr:dCMP deaminase family protein [Bacillales bacterium]